MALTLYGNAPAFRAATGYAFSLSALVTTYYNNYTSLFDTTGGAFNASTGKFTATIPGYYLITGAADFGANGVTANSTMGGGISKNGSSLVGNSIGNAGGFPTCPFSDLVYLNGTTDYVQIYGYTNGSTGASRGIFSGILVRSA